VVCNKAVTRTLAEATLIAPNRKHLDLKRCSRITKIRREKEALMERVNTILVSNIKVNNQEMHTIARKIVTSQLVKMVVHI